MRAKLTVLLMCGAFLLGFPGAGMSNEDNEEQQLTLDKRVEKVKQCLIDGELSWEKCAEDAGLQKEFQFNIPQSAFSERLNQMLAEQKETGLWTESLGGLWIPSPIERFTYSPHS